MKLISIKKITAMSALSLSVLAMSGCLGTTHLSSSITKEGTVLQQDIVFPDMNKAWQKQGQFPNSENLSKIKAGVSKDELYQLLGAPHFSEGQGAREWDYILKFDMPDNSVKTCQYKIIFDKQFKGQQFYWAPEGCPPAKAKALQPIVVERIVRVPFEVLVPAPAVKREQINLSADALFKFNKSSLQDVLPAGQAQITQLANKLKRYQSDADTSAVITGHTDYKGSDVYNMSLSLMRAQTVRAALMAQGVNGASLVATGAGEALPAKTCAVNLPRQQEIDCLQSNRRVTIDVSVTK